MGVIQDGTRDRFLSKLYLSGIEINYTTGIPRQFINSKLYLSGIEMGAVAESIWGV